MTIGAWSEIATRSAELKRSAAAAIAAATADPSTAQARILGTTGPEVQSTFEQLERETRRSVWALQPEPGDPRGLHDEADRSSRQRGLDQRTIVSDAAVDRPIAAPEALLRAQIRVAPVLLQMLLIDECRVVVEGPPGPVGRSGWLVWDDGTVAAACTLWAATESASRPVPPSALFLTLRQRDIARGLVDGRTDAAIARQIGVSARTVASEVRLLMDAVGASSRYQAGMRLFAD